jgi:hypothetical protein
MSLTAGARLGPYEITAALGAGGMGEVYRATDTRLGRDVAIKVLPADVASDPARLARFETEARAVSALNHPNIVTLYEVGTSDAGPYLVLEKIEGRSLREVLADGPLPIRRILTLAAQIAEGVAKAHAAGIVHRDLKPDNIMVTDDGFAKVLDFGLAKHVWPELGAAPIAETTLVKETGSNVILGTLGYLSPEQASGKPADYRADQFALGALMYEMATRERPFKRETMLESLTATIREEPEPVRSKRADVPAPLEWIIERCLQKDPNDRYASTSDLARDLVSMRDRLSDLTRGPAVEAPTRTRVLPRGLRGWAIAATVLAAIGIGGYVLGGRESSAPASASTPTYRALTFQRGIITGARFGSDGKTVYYSMAVGDGPSRVYMTRLDRAESKALDIPPAFILAVSSKDELAVLLTNDRAPYISPGLLAQVPAIGGVPRPLVEKATYADWSLNGERIVVARDTGCEFPLERRFAPACGLPRMSPDGQRIAIVKATPPRIVIRNADGVEVDLTHIPHVFGLAWSRDGREVWFTGSETGSPHERALFAVTLEGQRRLVARAPGSISVYDVASDGRSALVMTGAGWFGINAAINGEAKERALDHLGRTDIAGLSADGKWLLMNENREVGPGTYLRSTDGTQTIPISREVGRGLSPDRQWALVQTRERDREPRLRLVPTGAGAGRDLPLPPEVAPLVGDYVARWSPDSQRLFVPLVSTKGSAVRLYMLESDGSWKAVTPPAVRPPFVVSPNGQTVAIRDPTGVVTLYPVDGGTPTALAGERGAPVHWSADSRELFLAGPELLPARIYRRHLSTGRLEPWKSLAPADLTGVSHVMRVLIAADGVSYVYQYIRGLNELYLAYDLR